MSCAALVAIACHATAHSVAAAPVKATKRTSDDEKRASSKIVVGTAGEVAWIAADLAVRYSAGKGTTLRVVELVDPRGKATVASFGRIETPSGRIEPFTLPRTTAAGPLAEFLTSPRTAAAAIAADAHVIVEGTDKREYAVGPASAKKLLGRWGKLALTLDRDRVIEVRGTSAGFAVGYVNFPGEDAPIRMTGLMIAVPAGGGWKIVAVHYAPT